MAPPAPATRGPSAWASLTRSPPPRPPRLPPLPPLDDAPTAPAITSSSVSSPSAPDPDSAAEVDELLEGIDRVRIDDLWTTPRPNPDSRPSRTSAPTKHAPFRPGLFAPPHRPGTAAPLPSAAACAPPPVRTLAPLAENRSANANLPFHNPHSLHMPRRDLAVSRYNHSHNHNHSHALVPSSAPPPTHHHQHHHQHHHNPNRSNDFPGLFKVYACRNPEACVARGDTAECFGYHSIEKDRRRINVASYKPHMCRFIEEAGGCRKGDRCPFSHNDFERRYHPDRFGKETCRDFLRGDCPRNYCTFRHEVSSKVEIALNQMDAMNDKELLQLVLKIGEPRGRALCEKLLRRFGHGKKHSGWRLEGFKPHGRDDQKVKFVTGRVEEVKRQLRAAGEKKWASSLKTSSLRDMMSGVRKVGEEIRERCRSDENYVENGNEVHRLIRAVFSNTNWSCHSQEGDNPFLVTPENQSDAMDALERLVGIMVGKVGGGGSAEQRRLESSSGSRGYAKMMVSGAEFGRIGKGAHGTKDETKEGVGMERDGSVLWAVPASVGQATA